MAEESRAKPSGLKTAAEGRVQIYLAEDLARWLRLAAADRGLSRSEVVALALREHFAVDPPPGYQAPESDARAALTPARARYRAQALRAAGETHAAIADALNREGYATVNRRPWSKFAVARILRAEQ